MPESPNKPFWNTLPGYLTGIAALLTALVGLMRFVDERGHAARAAPEGVSTLQAPVKPEGGVAAPAPTRVVASTGSESPGLAPAPSPTGCDGVLGRWRWSVGPVGGAVDFGANGSAGWYAQANDPAPALIAKWSCTGAHSVLIEWPNGYEDRLTLASDGHKLSGSNQIGVIVTGTRP